MGFLRFLKRRTAVVLFLLLLVVFTASFANIGVFRIYSYVLAVADIKPPSLVWKSPPSAQGIRTLSPSTLRQTAVPPPPPHSIDQEQSLWGWIQLPLPLQQNDTHSRSLQDAAICGAPGPNYRITEQNDPVPDLYFHSSQPWVTEYFPQMPKTNLKPTVGQSQQWIAEGKDGAERHPYQLTSADGVWNLKRHVLNESAVNSAEGRFYRAHYSALACERASTAYWKLSKRLHMYSGQCPLLVQAMQAHQCQPQLQTRQTVNAQEQYWSKLPFLVNVMTRHVDVVVARNVTILKDFYKSCPGGRRHQGSYFFWSDGCWPKPDDDERHWSGNKTANWLQMDQFLHIVRKATIYNAKLNVHDMVRLKRQTYDKVLTIQQSFGFPHMMLEVLPKLMPFLHYFRTHPELVLYLSDVYINMTDIFTDILHIPKERIIMRSQIMARELWAPAASPCACIQGWQTHIMGIHLRQLARQRYQALIASDNLKKKHILLVWRRGRAFANFDEVREGIGRMFPGERLEIFNSTIHGTNLQETYRLFSGAKLVFGQQQGALTNMVFCDPGTAVVEFNKHNQLGAGEQYQAHYTYLATALGLRFYGFCSPNLVVRLDEMQRIFLLYI